MKKFLDYWIDAEREECYPENSEYLYILAGINTDGMSFSAHPPLHFVLKCKRSELEKAENSVIDLHSNTSVKLKFAMSTAFNILYFSYLEVPKGRILHFLDNENIEKYDYRKNKEYDEVYEDSSVENSWLSEKIPFNIKCWINDDSGNIGSISWNNSGKNSSMNFLKNTSEKYKNINIKKLCSFKALSLPYSAINDTMAISLGIQIFQSRCKRFENSLPAYILLKYNFTAIECNSLVNKNIVNFNQKFLSEDDYFQLIIYKDIQLREIICKTKNFKLSTHLLERLVNADYFKIDICNAPAINNLKDDFFYLIYLQGTSLTEELFFKIINDDDTGTCISILKDEKTMNFAKKHFANNPTVMLFLESIK